MHGAYCTDIRHRHHGGMLNKTPPPTELQIPATVTTLIAMKQANFTILAAGSIPASSTVRRAVTIFLGTNISIATVALLSTTVSKITIITLCPQTHHTQTMQAK